MKNRTLFGVIGAVVVLCLGALIGTAIYLVKKRPSGNTLTGRISQDAALVVNIDVAQARAWPVLNTLRNHITAPPSPENEARNEIARQYRDLQAGCGFDPWQKLERLNIGVERAVLAGRNQSAWVAFLDGGFTTPEAQRCVTWIAQRDHQVLTPEQVRSRTVHTIARDGQRVTPGTTQMALLDHTALFTARENMDHALAVIDGEQPALAAASPLAGMMSRLARPALLSAVVDIETLRAQNEHTVDEAINDLVRSNPTLPDLNLLRQARTGGLSLTVVGGAVNLTTRAELPSPPLAASLSRALASLIQNRREEVLSLLRDAQSSQSFLSALLGNTPGFAEKFSQIEAGFAAARGVIGQVQAQADGKDVVLTVPATQAQAVAIEAAVRAWTDVAAEMSRRNPLPNIFGRPGENNPAQGTGLPGGLRMPTDPNLTPPLLDTQPTPSEPPTRMEPDGPGGSGGALRP